MALQSQTTNRSTGFTNRTWDAGQGIDTSDVHLPQPQKQKQPVTLFYLKIK
jgi:hypothetical protein